MLSDIESANASDGLDHVYFTGTNTKLSPGDKLLFVQTSTSTPLALRTVSSVTPNSPSPQQTDVALTADSESFDDWTTPATKPLLHLTLKPSLLLPALSKFHLLAPTTPQSVTELSLSNVEAIISKYPEQSELVAFLTGQGWDYTDFAAVVNSYADSLNTSATDVQAYAMRVKTGAFGNTAPSYNTMSSTLTQPQPSTVYTFTSGTSGSGQNSLGVASTNGFVVGGQIIINPGGSDEETGVVASIPSSTSLNLQSNLANTHATGELVDMTLAPAAYPYNWDSPSSPFPINENSQETPYGSGSTVYLSSSYPAISEGEWTVLRCRDNATGDYTTGAYTISDVWDESKADFLVSAKVTGLSLNLGSVTPLSDFTMRGTTVYAQSEELELAGLADDTPIEGDQITLGGVVAGLEVGQSIAVTGQLYLQSGQSSSETVSEIVTIAGVTPYAPGSPFTTISVASLYSPPEGLANSYERATFSINANVALATHGSTVSNEILGGGDPSQPYLTFNLKQDPLTFISSPTSPTGTQSTLQVWVSNGGANILWNQAPNLYNLAANSQSYAVRIQDDSSVSVLFGNARPPVGTENITATYRVGIGSSGMVQANQLTLLSTKPLGLKSVTNPLPSTGAADPEDISDARQNAPLQVLTMGRIVSLDDCENFARSFQGVGKAVAVSAWAGETKYVRLIVASAMQGQVEQPLLGYLQTAIANFADPADPGQRRAVRPADFQHRRVDNHRGRPGAAHRASERPVRPPVGVLVRVHGLRRARPRERRGLHHPGGRRRRRQRRHVPLPHLGQRAPGERHSRLRHQRAADPEP